jgi:hypothetical protein
LPNLLALQPDKLFKHCTPLAEWPAPLLVAACSLSASDLLPKDLLVHVCACGWPTTLPVRSPTIRACALPSAVLGKHNVSHYAITAEKQAEQAWR